MLINYYQCFAKFVHVTPSVSEDAAMPWDEGTANAGTPGCGASSRCGGRAAIVIVTAISSLLFSFLEAEFGHPLTQLGLHGSLPVIRRCKRREISSCLHTALHAFLHTAS